MPLPPHDFGDEKQLAFDRVEAARILALLTSSDPETPPTQGPFGVAPDPKSTGTGHGKQHPPWTAADQKQIDTWKALNLGSDGRIKQPSETSKPFHAQMLIRSFAGDLGARPSATTSYQSVDIWTVSQKTPPVPVATPVWSPAALVYTNGFTTLYAHVWNLGLAPVIGARVEFWEAAHQATGFPAPTKFIGIARVDLANRHSKRCQAIVACPVTYQPSPQFCAPAGALLEIVVRVSGFGDPAPENVWDPTQTRHIARKIMKCERAV